nr:transposase [Rhodococcus marinonascens]
MRTLNGKTITAYCGIDVGKSHHHAVALDSNGNRLYDKEFPQDETRLREPFTDLGQHGPVMVIADQPHSIGALPVSVARNARLVVTYLPGLAMRRIADLHPATPKPMPATRSSSPRPHAPYRRPCD